MTLAGAKQMTAIVILAVVALLIAYDVVVEMRFGYEATISQVIFSTVTRYPWIAFAGGFLCGHWIWR